MDWKIKFTEQADKEIRKLDKTVSSKILDAIESISRLENPRSRGKALTGHLAGLWSYRVGNYRIVCDIEDEELVVLVIEVAHRREAYRRR